MTQGWVGMLVLVSANFGWLVLGCIEADFCNQILIFKALFEIYKIYTPLHHSKFKIFKNI